MSSTEMPKAMAAIEKRVKEQLERHFAIDPNADPKKIIELTIRQIKDELNAKIERINDVEETNADNEFRALALRIAIDEYLPEIEKKLKSR